MNTDTLSEDIAKILPSYYSAQENVKVEKLVRDQVNNVLKNLDSRIDLNLAALDTRFSIGGELYAAGQIEALHWTLEEIKKAML